jgi:hypothetical protein
MAKILIIILLILPTISEALTFQEIADGFGNQLYLNEDGTYSIEDVENSDLNTEQLNLELEIYEDLKQFLPDNEGLPLGIKEQFSFTITPNNPTLGDEVLIKAISYGSDISNKNISWYKNNILEESGLGQNTFSFTLDTINENTNIRAEISTNSGIIKRDFSFNGGSIDLLIEPQTFTPPFYKGKSWPTLGSLIKIVAIPDIYINGIKKESNDFSYNWEINGENLSGGYAYNKNVMYYEPGLLEESLQISLSVSPTDSGLEISTLKDISLKKPLIANYLHSSTLGILFNSMLIGSFNIEIDEFQIKTIPYFFSNKDVESLIYKRTVSGIETNDFGDNITLRVEGSDFVETIMNTSVLNNEMILQEAYDSLLLINNL